MGTGIAFPLAITAAIPTLVVMTLSSYRTLGEWLNRFFLKKHESSVFQHYYPKLHKVTRLVAFSIALLAPTAAAYITHDTLIHKLDSLWVWTAVIFMIASRDLFAYFSLSQLSSKFILYCLKHARFRNSKSLNLSIRIEELAERIHSMDGYAFEQLIKTLPKPSHEIYIK